MASTTDILVAINDGVAALNKLSEQLSVGLQTIAVGATAPTSAGLVTFTSSRASGFLAITTSSGATYQVPVYL